MTQTNLHYWLATLYLEKIGPAKILKWLEHFSSIEKLFLASLEELKFAGLNEQQIHAIKHPNWQQVENDLAWAVQPNQTLVSIEDANYPELLKQIYLPPLILFIQGNQSALHQKQLAIVGARNATPNGVRNAEQFAFYLAQTGFAITSGLALGIDGASHKGALKAKGITIGIAGTGLAQLYPSANRQLSEDIIAQGGAIVSEFQLKTGPYAGNFPRRNRIISGLSVGVLIVEAALRSGSLITARYALEQGREVFAIPGSIHHPLSKGCNHLIKQGAKLVETAQDVLEELGCSFQNQSQKTVIAPSLLPAYSSILKQIDYEMTPIDMIILQSGLTAAEVSSILLKLELQGYIQSVPGGYVRVAQ